MTMTPVLDVSVQRLETPSWTYIPPNEGECLQVGEYGFWLRPAWLVVYRHGEPVYRTDLNAICALVRRHLELLKLLDKPIEPEIVAGSDGTPDLDDRGEVMVWQVNVTDPSAVRWYVMGGGGLERAFLKVRAGDRVAHFELRIPSGRAQVMRDGTLLATAPADPELRPRAWAARFYTETARRLLREWAEAGGASEAGDRPEPQAVSPGRPAAGETEASSSHFVGEPNPARAEGPAQPANRAEATIFAAVYAASLHAASTTGVRGGDPSADAWAAVAEWREGQSRKAGTQ